MYRNWCGQSFFQNVAKSIFNLLIKVEIGSEMSMIGSIAIRFPQAGNPVKEEMMHMLATKFEDHAL